ncbi:MAG: lysine--tRNA ligase [Firmicutes bacterium]|nr:lysine--tRNA ligase [Bacillota bacterium]
MANENQKNGQDLNQILKLKREKFKELQDAGKDPFLITKFDVTHHSTDIRDHFDDLEGQTVRIAGRMMSKRVMGKASFMHVQDKPGQVQCYVTRDSIGDEAYQDFKRYQDVGDIVGVEGYVFRTQKGEISIHATSVTLLSKSLQTLPEKFHGLTDTETRYRQRYLDLVMNPDVKETLIRRSQILSSIRRYLDSQGFLEVETPILVSNAGGAAARPFFTHYNALNEERKLRISLELYLKRLIVGGLEKVYEIGRVFRNEGIDNRHNPEFTMMELYQAYTDYHGMMDLTESLFRHVSQEVLGTQTIVYNGVTMDLSQPFARLSMRDAVKQYAGIDWNEVKDLEEARNLAKEHGIEFEERHKKGDILNLFFEKYVEDHLLQPTFITDHPIEISPLTKKKPGEPEYVERFEFYMNAWEMANAYSELNDPIDQRERFRAQEELLAQGDEEANHTDEDFLNALELGMPPTGGIGFGIDRMVMLLTGAETIKDALLFPTMKPIGKDRENMERDFARATAEINAEEKVEKPEEVIDFSNVVIEPLFEDQVDFETFSKSDFRAVKVLECEAVPKSKKLLKFTLDDGSGVNRTILSGIHAYYEPEELVGKTCIAITNLPPRAMMGIESCGMLISAVHKEGEEEKLHLLMVDPHIPAGAKLY